MSDAGVGVVRMAMPFSERQAEIRLKCLAGDIICSTTASDKTQSKVVGGCHSSRLALNKVRSCARVWSRSTSTPAELTAGKRGLQVLEVASVIPATEFQNGNVVFCRSQSTYCLYGNS